MKELGHKSAIERFDANTRACDTVLRSIGTFPQSGEGLILIAKRALDKIQGDPYQPSISDLAEINPDGERSAKKINAFHDRFGISYRVGEPEAERFLVTFAYNTIDYLRHKTVVAADNTQTGIPDELRTPIYNAENTLKERDVTDLERSKLLETTLNKNPDLLAVVYTDVHASAEDVKSRAPKQRQFAQQLGETHKIFKHSENKEK